MPSEDLESVIFYLSKLPGIGKRSAKRVALHMIKNREDIMLPLASLIEKTAHSIKICSECKNIDGCDPCYICQDSKRTKNTICVVEDVSDLWAIERGNFYKGVYHVLGGTLSAIDGKNPEDLNIDKLLDRVNSQKIDEIILATNSTVEGQTTSYYIIECLRGKEIKISRLAQGIPMGGELDYLDDGTLSTAINSRLPLETIKD